MSTLELTSALLLSCLITGTWLSLRSWMRSLQSLVSAQSLLREGQIQGLEDRQQEQLLQSLEKLEAILQVQQRALLVEAMRPLAEALQRQDQMHLAQSKELQELLLEILQATQPSALTQLSPLIGQPSLPPSSQSLAS